MKTEICKKFDSYEKEMLDQLKTLVEIQSLPDRTSPSGMPTSDEVVKILHHTLELAKSLGFKTVNENDDYGYAEIGEGEKCIGVFLHLDVVPPGNGWTREPFDCQIEDGKIYGRGALDNKSPAIVCLYGTKVLMDLGIDLNCRIRLFFGTCEETGMADVRKYIETHGHPTASIVPDSQFPLAYCEKGVVYLNMFKAGKAEDENLLLTKFDGGSARNMVADFATAELVAKTNDGANDVATKLQEYVKEQKCDITAQVEGNTVKFVSNGIPGHANEPHRGVNAVLQLVFFLNSLNINDGRGDILRFIVDKITNKYDGTGLNIKTVCESSELVCNLSLFNLTQDGVKFTINFRHPAEADVNEIMGRLKATLDECDVSIEESDILPSVYLDKESNLLKLLYKNYQELTNDDTPMKACGATYAKYIYNAVPFGAIFTEEFDKCHHSDEFVRVDHMMLGGRIYATSIYDMAKNIDII